MNDQVKDLFASAKKDEAGFEFDRAKKAYSEITSHFPDSEEAAISKGRLAVMDDLIQEKQIYERIDENAKKVLTDIGINIAENQRLMDILMEADAINFESDVAVSIPLKRDYLEACLEKIDRSMPCDPGKNAFGTGATPPFLKREGDDDLRAASKEEFQEIVNTVAEHSSEVKIFSLPVATDKSISAFEVVKCMDQGFKGLKMTAGKSLGDDEISFLKDKDTWLDGTSLITSLSPMNSMVEPFIRSAQSGANLLLLDLSIAGSSAAGSPEALLTQIHAQVMFMMVMAQTLNPGVRCMHGGIPGVDEAGGDLSYSAARQPLINAAMARVNQWITKFPSAQSGGSTSLTEVTDQAVLESAQSRNVLRKYGVHVIRHAMGALGSLNYFSLEKFVRDCASEKADALEFSSNPDSGWVQPLYFPKDNQTMDGLREIAEKGNPKLANHTLTNVESFMKWEREIEKRSV